MSLIEQQLVSNIDVLKKKKKCLISVVWFSYFKPVVLLITKAIIEDDSG